MATSRIYLIIEHRINKFLRANERGTPAAADAQRRHRNVTKRITMRYYTTRRR